MAATGPASANASDMFSGAKIQPVSQSEIARDQQKSFSVFFEAHQASLTPEGREIIFEAAKRFVEGYSSYDRVFVISNTPTAEDLSVNRADVVREELERDGVKSEFINTVQQFRPVPASLQKWQNRRVLIAIRSNAASESNDPLG